ncbi:MAG: hypothetical protein J1E78_06410 [Muribaculaceae bacterium]|nr:hypothetical protein [Muribaculaceae bacterium]
MVASRTFFRRLDTFEDVATNQTLPFDGLVAYYLNDNKEIDKIREIGRFTSQQEDQRNPLTR